MFTALRTLVSPVELEFSRIEKMVLDTIHHQIFMTEDYIKKSESPEQTAATG